MVFVQKKECALHLTYYVQIAGHAVITTKRNPRTLKKKQKKKKKKKKKQVIQKMKKIKTKKVNRDQTTKKMALNRTVPLGQEKAPSQAVMTLKKIVKTATRNNLNLILHLNIRTTRFEGPIKSFQAVFALIYTIFT